MSVRLMHGDCLELMKEIEPGSVDLVLTDPPYGITSRNPWDKVLNFQQMWDGIHHAVKKSTPVLLFGQLPFGSDLIQSNRKEYRYEWIWKKTMTLGYLNAKKMPLRIHENILVFYGSLPLYNPQFWKALKAHRRGGDWQFNELRRASSRAGN